MLKQSVSPEFSGKRITLTILIVLLASTFVFADEWISFEGKGEASPEYDILQSNSSYVEFELEIPGMKSRDVNSYNRLYVPEHAKMDSVGYPEVPFVSYLIAIPECNSVDLNVTVLDSVVIDSMNVYPAPEWVNMEEVFTLNAAAYGTDAYFPGYTGELTGKGAVRAQHCIRVNIYPVQFNPVQQEVIAYSRVNIEMSFSGVSGSINEDVGIFNAVCGASMINYDSNGLTGSVSCGAGYDDPGKIKWLQDLDSLCMGEQGIHCDYLIITHDSFWVNPYIDSLAQKRANYNGFDVAIVKMGDIESQISGINNTFRIKNLMVDIYNDGHADHTYDDRIGYVNLFGDAYFGEDPTDDCVPTHPYQDSNGGFDNYFARLTEVGGDYDVYPDILIGRCPVDDTTQVKNVCKKIINYEPIPSTTSWLNNMTFVNTAYAYSANVGFDIILPLIEGYDKTLVTYLLLDEYIGTDEIHEGFGTDTLASIPRSNLQGLYQTGNLMISYMGHGGAWKLKPDSTSPYFNYDHVNSYDYNGRLPFISSMSCDTGNFQAQDECMAEQFLVCNDKRGAIAFIAAPVSTNLGTFCNFAPWVFESAFRYNLGMCGEMLLGGKLKTEDDQYRKIFDLFGDPALNILLDSDNISECDLQCSYQSITAENFNNQTLQVNAGVINRSQVNITNSFEVKGYLINNPLGTTDSTTSCTIDSLSAMGEASVEFNFDISHSMPGEYTILIHVDPDNVICERNEYNNETEISYDFYRPLDGFPAFVANDIFREDNIPLYYKGYIVYDGNKISPSGNSLWDSSIRTNFLPLPVENDSTGNLDYIISDGSNIYRIDGSTGDSIWVYSNYLINDPCLGDINNDGVKEILMRAYHRIIILDLDGNVMLEEVFSNKFPGDIGIGDGNGDGKNEIYLSCSVTSCELFCYEYDGGTLTEVNYKNFDKAPRKLVLTDFNNDGALDCIVISDEKLYFLDCSDFSNLFPPAELTNSLSGIAIGDIYNDGIPEVLTFETDGSFYTIDSDGTYDYLFNIGNNQRGSYEDVILYDLDSDNELDVVLYKSEDLSGYTLNGELLFSFPNNEEKSFPIIYDIDSDDDIEFIFSENISGYENYNSWLMVSDLPLSPGNHSNIYPNMNEWNNNLYSQPITDTLDNGTTYYWDGSVTLHGDVTLPDSSALHILPGTVIKAREDSRLIINGNLIAEGTEDNPIVFEPDIYDAPSNYWYGLEIYSPGSITIAHCRINNAGDTIICVHNNAELVITDNLNVNGKISVTTGGELSIADNSIVTCMNSDTSIEVEGTISLCDSVTFTSPESVRWDGLYLYNTEASIEMDGVTFERGMVENESDSLTISNCEFNNATLKQYGNKLFLSYSDFDTSNVYCTYSGSGSKNKDPDDVEINISQCTFAHSPAYTVFIYNYDLFDVNYNTFSNCNGSCLRLYYSGNPQLCNISSNTIEDNGGYGISLYNSYADILARNTITGNYYGIFASNNSTPSLQGTWYAGTQEIYDNQYEEIVIDLQSYPDLFTANLIYDDSYPYATGTGDQYLVRCDIDTSSVPARSLDAMLNYWGEESESWTQWDGDERFSPDTCFCYLPIFMPSYKGEEQAQEELLYLEADSLFKQKQYKDVETLYHRIIDEYPLTKYAEHSIRNLLPLEAVTEQDFSSLRDYYLTDPICNISEERAKLCKHLANWCTIELGDYPTAIGFFEDIISHPDTKRDSVYAVIDAGHTYLLMENSGKPDYVGKMPELKPKSREDFFTTSDKLITDLFGLLEGENNEEPETEYAFELRYNYPNPFRGSTKISFSLPASTQKADLKIYNIRGQLIRKLDIDNTPGIRSISWDGLDTYGKKVSSGIYFYRLTADKKETIKKMVIIR